MLTQDGACAAGDCTTQASPGTETCQPSHTHTTAQHACEMPHAQTPLTQHSKAPTACANWQRSRVHTASLCACCNIAPKHRRLSTHGKHTHPAQQQYPSTRTHTSHHNLQLNWPYYQHHTGAGRVKWAAEFGSCKTPSMQLKPKLPAAGAKALVPACLNDSCSLMMPCVTSTQWLFLLLNSSSSSNRPSFRM